MKRRLFPTILLGSFLLSSAVSTANVSAKTIGSGGVKDGGATATALLIAAAFQFALEEGFLGFPFHSGPDECRNLRRYNSTRAVLERAESGQDAALKELHHFINASSMNRNCVRSITAGFFGDIESKLDDFIASTRESDPQPEPPSFDYAQPLIFDVQFYSDTYPDLKQAFGSDFSAATEHWIKQGLPNEGRRGSREFDVQFYLDTYPDLKQAFGSDFSAATEHWIKQGLPNEGRRGSREFDVQFYLDTYPDLKQAFGSDFSAATEHWIKQGLPNEGRRGSREFDVQFYLDTHSDLKQAFGNNFIAAFDHWIKQGLPNEGRRGSDEL